MKNFIKTIKPYIFLYIILALLFTISSLYILKYCYDMYNSKSEKYLLDKISYEEPVASANNTLEDGSIDSENDPPENERIKKVKKLQEQNSDIVGWIEIEDTDISYPVLQGDDNEYYLDHNYQKKYSVNGSIFLDKDYSWEPLSSNLMIYGHHTMFEDLLKYKKESFYKSHPTIRFTTNTEDINYKIISVFYSRAYYQYEKNVFRYYFFISAKTKDEYDDFVKNAKKASIYNIEETANFR